MVYDSMGVLKNEEEIWMKRLDEIKKYIDDNNKFTLRISWRNANKDKDTDCNDMIKSCYNISTGIIKNQIKKNKRNKLIKKSNLQKYLKYKLKYLELKQLLE